MFHLPGRLSRAGERRNRFGIQLRFCRPPQGVLRFLPPAPHHARSLPGNIRPVEPGFSLRVLLV